MSEYFTKNKVLFLKSKWTEEAESEEVDSDDCLFIDD